MVRLRGLRNFIQELAESPLIEKISFVLPFFVIIIDIIILEHAIRIQEVYIIVLTTLLFFLSVVEIAVAMGEIHDRYQQNNFERTLTIKLDDFMLEQKNNNVKKIVEDFIDMHLEYKNKRSEIYHITCQIMETHKEEAWEEALLKKLKPFIKRRKKMNVDEILMAFIKKYPTYKKNRTKIYQKTCQLKSVPEENKEKTFRG
jgi:hypothetical protein